MDLAWWRDLVIVILGLVGTVALVSITIVAILLYKRILKTMDSFDMVAARTSDLIDYAEEEVIQPVAQVGGLIQGVIKGVGFVSKLFSKKEAKSDE